MGVALVAWVVAPENPAPAWLLLASALMSGLRLARWAGGRTWGRAPARYPAFGLWWLAIGLAMLGLSGLVEWMPRASGIHALTAGAIGTMTLAVMTRASLGHLAYPLTAGTDTTALYVLVNLSAVLRVVTPWAEGIETILWLASGIAWIAAFGGFLVFYLPRLVRPRFAEATPAMS